MEKLGDKGRDRDRVKYDSGMGYHNEGPCYNNTTMGKSPDLTPASRNGYYSSSSPSGSNSGDGNSNININSVSNSNSSSQKGASTKNIGVGANLNTNNPVSRQLRLGNTNTNTINSSSNNNNNNNCPGQTVTTSGLMSRALPPSVSPASTAMLPEIVSRSLPMGLASSTSPGIPSTSTKSELIPSANKIVSQNINGTLAVTSVPTNDSELQLYRVLQRANLLNYFDVMIELGGDDVQQLSDAGEEEFLEICSLVGMASKPLHVRRLQKALHEWRNCPNLFQIPLLGSHIPAFGMPPVSTTPTSSSLHSGGRDESSSPQMPIRPIPFHSGNHSQPIFLNPSELMKNLQTKLSSLRGSSSGETHGSNSNSPLGNLPPTNNNISTNTNSNSNQSLNSLTQTINMNMNHPTNMNINGNPSSLSMNMNMNGSASRISPDSIIPSHFLEQRIRTRSETSSPASSSESPQLDSRTSLSPVPFLQEHEIQKLSETAVQVISGLPSSMVEPRLSAKKKICAEFDAVIRIPENDPNRMDMVRKYAAIYGRNDCKRKIAKPLTLHELFVNEAASQLCSRVPSLLTRRDELFPLARQVVKEAGLPYCSMSSGGGGMSISLLPKTIQNDETHKMNNNNSMSIASHYSTNNNLNNSYNNGKRMKIQESKNTDIQELKSSNFSTDINESNSEDSTHFNESASIHHQRSVSALGRRIPDRIFSNFEKSDSSSRDSNSSNQRALDMSSGHEEEANDLSVVKNVNKCNSVRNNSIHNIKSEPVS